MVVMLARATVVIGTLLAWSMATTMHATASCAVEPGPHDPTAGAGVAFIGTVVSATDDQHRALVRVESVWRGPPPLAAVHLRGAACPPPPPRPLGFCNSQPPPPPPVRSPEPHHP